LTDRPDRGAARPSLYWRATGLVTAVLAATGLALAALAGSYARSAADDAYDRLLLAAALQISESLSVEDGRLLVDPPFAAFETLALAADDRVFYAVTAPDGTILTGYDDLPPALPPRPAGTGPSFGDGVFSGARVRHVRVRRAIPDLAAPGFAEVALAQTTEARGRLARDLIGRALALLGAMMLLGFLAALLAVRLALAPLARLERAMRARDPKDLTPIAVEAPREVAALVAAIDGFTERLARHLAVLQRFIAEASHQIRTPLAALNAQVEMLVWSADDPDAEARRDRLLRVQARAQELARLTNQLLDHAMVSHRVETLRFTPVDLAALARAILLDRAGTLAREVDLGFDGPDRPVLVAGDALSLREAVANLVGNALKHGARTRLDVTVAAEGGEGRLTVADDGPGIPPQAWSRVTRPFEGAGGTKGAGLGLSIASDVVRAHGGRLAFATLPDGRFAVTIAIPLTAQDPA
jgi:two-component system sensor histidine kinase TctE